VNELPAQGQGLDWDELLSLCATVIAPLYAVVVVAAERSTSVIGISICSPLGIDMLTFAVW
jgi:hypothetical protein